VIALIDNARRSVVSWFSAKEPEESISSDESEDSVFGMVIPSQGNPKYRTGIGTKYHPARVSSILQDAVTNGTDLVPQWELFDAMESLWPRLTKNLFELKNAVSRSHFIVEPFIEDGKQEPSATAKAKADLIERAIKSMDSKPGSMATGFEDGLFDLCDAIGKGIAVLEIDWELEEDGMILPDSFTWVHPYYYGFPTDSTKLALKPDGVSWVEWPENKFIIASFKTKSGALASQGFLRPLAWWYSATQFSKDWILRFAERFGIPMRVATYNQALSTDVKAAISAMLENMGSAGWAALPEGVKVDLIEAVSSATNNPQERVQQLADKNCDLLLLGQTLTSDVGDSGSRALGDVHAAIRTERVQMLARWVADVLNYQLIPSILELNYGDDSECPTIVADFTEEEDPLIMAQRDQALSAIGMVFPQQFMEQRHHIPAAEAGEAVISKPQPQPSLFAGDNMTQAKAIISAKVADSEVPERLMENVLERVTGVNHQWLAPVKPFFQAIVAKALDSHISDDDFRKTLEDARRALPELFDRLDSKAVQNALEGAMGAAMVNGAIKRDLTR
jgi:phage gp29-like protein